MFYVGGCVVAVSEDVRRKCQRMWWRMYRGLQRMCGGCVEDMWRMSGQCCKSVRPMLLDFLPRHAQP